MALWMHPDIVCMCGAVYFSESPGFPGLFFWFFWADFSLLVDITPFLIVSPDSPPLPCKLQLLSCPRRTLVTDGLACPSGKRELRCESGTAPPL